jgi:nitrate/TMAO reductase-like tetraheme cytochrome c subunit
MLETHQESIRGNSLSVHVNTERAGATAHAWRYSQRHQQAAEAGLNCIDCHKGIAYGLPRPLIPTRM